MPQASPLVSTPPLRRRVHDAPFRCTGFDAGRDATWISASGAVDVAGSRRLEQILDEAQTRARLVVLDAHDLTFSDTAGVQVVVEASRYARLAGNRLVVLRQPQTLDALGLTGMVDEIDIHHLGPGV